MDVYFGFVETGRLGVYRPTEDLELHAHIASIGTEIFDDEVLSKLDTSDTVGPVGIFEVLALLACIFFHPLRGVEMPLSAYVTYFALCVPMNSPVFALGCVVGILILIRVVASATIEMHVLWRGSVYI